MQTTRPTNRAEQGQAFSELAIMGTVALAALAFLIQIGLQVNFQQEMDMETFRVNMATANKAGLFEPPPRVSYIQYRDRQMPDVEQGFAIMPRALFQSATSMTWSDHLHLTDEGDLDTEPLTVVNVNGVERRFTEDQFAAGATPLVTKITRATSASGTVTQPNATSSSTSTTTDQNTTVWLKNGSQVTGGVNSSVNWNW